MAGLLPMDDRDGVIWLNGNLVPWRDAKVHVLTHALHYASSVFEGMRSYDGKVFLMTEHHQRLHMSARLLGFPVPYTVEELNTAAMATMAANGFTNCYLRPFAWRGAVGGGIGNRHNEDIQVCIATWDWPSYFDAETKMKGIRLMMSPWRRPAPDTAPCASKAAGLYMICTMSKNAAEEAGFADGLMMDWRGRIAEASASNIFFIKNGEIHTPEADCFLNGLTRQTVIARARALGYKVTERAIWPQELASFDEAFLTGTAVEITPIGEIAGLKYTVGPVTQALMADYSALVQPGRLRA